MCSRRASALSSIPERSEDEREPPAAERRDRERARWVSKKKHDVLKAKYKCLKKLFQVYDASLVGFLPEPYAGPCGDSFALDEKPSARKKRSRRRRQEAGAGTEEDGSQSEVAVSEAETQAAAAVRSKHAGTQATDVGRALCEFTQTSPDAPVVVPYLALGERKPSRFQRLLQRILGLKVEPVAVKVSSDNKVSYGEKRRRRGLRLRRLRRQKWSEWSLQSPAVLSAQAVQRRYLLDTTPQPCPVLGCNMTLYGVIKYNDHLNLCHYRERKFVCHYCHLGFENEYDKIGHEYEHTGINKVSSNMHSVASTERNSVTASVTQTDPETSREFIPDEKLKKIISFFDKIDSEQVISEMKKNRFSESNLQCKLEENSSSDSDKSSKRTVSCVNLSKQTSGPASCLTDHTSKCSIVTVKCPYCDDEFKTRRQLSVHVEMEHRALDKYSKYPRSGSSAGSHRVQSLPGRVCVSGSSDCTDVVYTSTESIRKPTFLNNLIQNVKSRVSYKWEPTESVH